LFPLLSSSQLFLFTKYEDIVSENRFLLLQDSSSILIDDDDDDDDDEEDDLNVGSETNEDSNSRGARKRKHEDTDDADSKTQ
jgi:hypothetical protein